jgi:hypothetical protein
VVFRSLDDLRAAMATIVEGGSLTVVSAPAAAAHAGAGWFRAVVEAARAERPGAAVTAILDCAALPGLVLAGVRAGVRDLRYSGDDETFARLAAIAAAAGATLHRHWPQPE